MMQGEFPVAVDLGMRILIVDDFRTMLRILGNHLRQIGFSRIDEATDGGMALQKLSRDSYGLIFSDWNMSPMSGLELLKQVRTNPETKTIPFIMVTAESTPENVIAARQAGASNYIVKPFTPEILKRKLVGVLGDF